MGATIRSITVVGIQARRCCLETADDTASMILGLPPPVPVAQVIVASRGMSKGVAQTDGPQFVARGWLQFGSVRLGTEWKNVSAANGKGEATFFLSDGRDLGTVHFVFGAEYKFRTSVRSKALRTRTDATTLQFSAAASRKFGPVSLRLGVAYSPIEFGSSRGSIYVDGGPAIDLGEGWAVSAAVGRRERNGAADYTAFNAGVAKTFGRFQVDLRYYDTAQHELGITYDSRVVASARLTF